MVEIIPIIAVANPHPVSCARCGEGGLVYSKLRNASTPAPQYGFHCPLCSFTLPDTTQ